MIIPSDPPIFETEEEKRRRQTNNILSITSGLSVLGLAIWIATRADRAPDDREETEEERRRRRRSNLSSRITSGILITAGLLQTLNITTLNEDGSIR